MEIVEWIADKISGEIQDGNAYAKMAAKCKEECPDISRMLHDLAREEMDHANKLHNAVAEMMESNQNK